MRDENPADTLEKLSLLLAQKSYFEQEQYNLFKVGYGFDIHKLETGDRDFLLGGVVIDCDKQVDAISDGDVVIHAIANAIYSAFGQDDIGAHFPPEKYKKELEKGHRLSGREIINDAVKVYLDADYRIGNVVVDIILEKPILRPYINKIKSKLAYLLFCSETAITVHANTCEGLGSIGKGEAIAVTANIMFTNTTKIKEIFDYVKSTRTN